MSEDTPNSAVRTRKRLENEWLALTESASEELKSLLIATLEFNTSELRDRYHEYLAQDDEISSILNGDANRDEFTHAFLRWVGDVLDPGSITKQEFFDRQAQIGALMARIGLPPYAVSRATRKLTIWLVRHFAERQLPRDQIIDVLTHIVNVIGISLEIREISYQSSSISRARVDEAYKLHALGQNIALERERQRALLMEWGHSLLASLHQAETLRRMPRIWPSEFGLWLNHKARIVFEKVPHLNVVMASANQIDNELIPALEQTKPEDRGSVAFLIARIEQQISTIKFNLNAMFDLHIDLDQARDPLTQLLNRKFLPTILMREIELQRSADDNGICLLLIDIDEFKKINELYGHTAGDLTLQHVAQAVVHGLSSSDFVFRYGDEQILVVLVNCTEELALRKAEQLKKNVAAHAVTLPKGTDIFPTLSVGLAVHEREFDYQALLNRADRAVVVAKAAGKDGIGRA